MKVFLSWSKSDSRRVATKLHDWLPEVVQRLEPWISSEDIDKGQRWNHEVSARLEECSYGIICVTRENMNEPWLNFEAGALARSVSASRVSPVLLNLSSTDLVGPLAQFQVTALTDRGDTFRLLTSLNKISDRPLTDGQLSRAFDKCWDDLLKTLGGINSSTPASKPNPARSSDEKIDEILSLVRGLKRQTGEGIQPRSRRTVPRIAPGVDVYVDLRAIATNLGLITIPASPDLTVSEFLNLLFFAMDHAVRPYTFGTAWTLLDVDQDKILNDLESPWSRGEDRKSDRRQLAETSIRPGMTLRVIPIARDADGRPTSSS